MKLSILCRKNTDSVYDPINSNNRSHINSHQLPSEHCIYFIWQQKQARSTNDAILRLTFAENLTAVTKHQILHRIAVMPGIRIWQCQSVCKQRCAVRPQGSFSLLETFQMY